MIEGQPQRLERGMRWLLAAVIAALLLGTAGAEACSAVRLFGPDELVRTADAIARVRVIGAAPASAEPSSWPHGAVRLEVLEVLSGRLPGSKLVLPGRLRDYPSSPRRPVPYDGVDCARAGGCGGCFAYDYKLGAQYLLLLKQGTPYWAALAPTNEEVSGPSDPWVTWVSRRLAVEPKR